jgi:signal peptidase II
MGQKGLIWRGKIPDMKNGWKIVLFCLLCVVFIGCDRVTKDLAKSELAEKGTLTFFHDILRLQYTENTGAALGVGDQLSGRASFWLLSVMPLGVMIFLFAYILRTFSRNSVYRLLALALIFAGGMGNIIDRLVFDRHVTDFINVDLPILRTGIFNFADFYITTGVVLLIAISLQHFRSAPDRPGFDHSSRKQ